jgi:hypothetical protein
MNDRTADMLELFDLLDLAEIPDNALSLPDLVGEPMLHALLPALLSVPDLGVEPLTDIVAAGWPDAAVIFPPYKPDSPATRSKIVACLRQADVNRVEAGHNHDD